MACLFGVPGEPADRDFTRRKPPCNPPLHVPTGGESKLSPNKIVFSGIKVHQSDDQEYTWSHPRTKFGSFSCCSSREGGHGQSSFPSISGGWEVTLGCVTLRRDVRRRRGPGLDAVTGGFRR